MGTLCEVGGGEQTILGVGCSSSESDSLRLCDASVSSKKSRVSIAECFSADADVFGWDTENIMDAGVYLRSHGSSSLGFSSETNQLGANVTDVFGFASYPDQLLISVHWCRGEEWGSVHRHTEFNSHECIARSLYWQWTHKYVEVHIITDRYVRNKLHHMPVNGTYVNCQHSQRSSD